MNFEPSRPEAEIMQEYVDAWDYLYEPSRYLARTYRYYLAMRPAPGRRWTLRRANRPMTFFRPGDDLARISQSGRSSEFSGCKGFVRRTGVNSGPS